jgi:serine/threonine protein kinase
MHPWEVVDSYRQFHPRWFESVDRYEPGNEHRKIFHALFGDRWRLRRSGMWYIAEPHDAEMPDQGWKLHISSVTNETENVLQRALPILLDEQVTFKFLIDRHIAAMVNGKVWPRGSAGKFIAIYPETVDHFHRLGERLRAELHDVTGPYILSDRPWPHSRCVFYRYGGFRAKSILQRDGTRNLVIDTPDGGQVQDVRHPFWSPPAWATDPLEGMPAPPTREQGQSMVLADGRFEVRSAMAFSSRGGVYLAEDRQTNETVILKEARPKVEIGQFAVDSVDTLKKEYRLLNRLADTGYFPRPVALFQEWEHYFLAQEYIDSQHFGVFTIRRNPLYWADRPRSALIEYFDTMRPLWTQLARAINAAHERSIVLGDLSFTNVLVEGTESVRIIDLEAATERDVDPEVGLYTPGVSGMRVGRGAPTGPADDYSSLAAVIFGSVMLVPGITGFHPPARARFLDELQDDIGLTDEFIELVEDLDSLTVAAHPADMIERIANIQILSADSPGFTSPDGRATSGPARRARGEIRRAVEATVDGIAAYLQQTATPERSDRLFPADLAVFRTNPESVAYGAAGVLHALNRLDGCLPSELADWLLRRPLSNDTHPPGLYLGQAGIAWVLAELGHADRAVDIMRTARRHPLLLTSPNILHGGAGYGTTCLKLWRAGAGSDFLHEAVRAGDYVAHQAVRDSAGSRWTDDDGAVRLGYLHGGSGISSFLLFLYLATSNRDWLELGRDALRFELSQAAVRDGVVVGFPEHATDDPINSKVLRSYWDAGSAGVLTTLARYLAVSEDPELDAWVAMLQPDVARKYVVFPQLFHGLAGLGNSLLDLWEYGRRVSALDDAWRVAEGVLLFGIERSEGLAFPGEQAIRESADFATGSAGVGLFLHRLLQADKGIRQGSFNFVVDELIPNSCGPSEVARRNHAR